MVLQLMGMMDGNPVSLKTLRFGDIDVMKELERQGYAERAGDMGYAAEELVITQKGVQLVRQAAANFTAVGQMQRPMVTAEAVEDAIKFVSDEMTRRLQQKGRGALVSRHEIVGIIEEELDELKREMHANSNDREVIAELADVAVPAIFGIACIRSGLARK
jgi:predicted peroxiredoxin